MSPSPEQLRSVLVAERQGLADLADTLDDAQLATPSLCGDWTVKDVVAHVAFSCQRPTREFLRALARARGSFDEANSEIACSWGRRPTAEVTRTLRQWAGHHLSNPGQGVAGPLTDALVHAGDVRRPLGLPHDADPDAAAVCLRFLVTGRPFGFVPRSRVAGLGFLAEDAGDGAGAAFGDGPIVRGRALDLLMAVCGRRVAFAAVQGPGVAELERRLG